MEIAKYIEVKNPAGVPRAFLSPKADGLKEAYIDTRLNGESTLEFLMPAISPKIDEITAESTLWVGNRVFSLLKDEASDTIMEDNGSLWAKYMAVERWNELDRSYIEPYLSNDPSTPSPADLTTIIVGGGSNLSGGLYTTGTAAHALYAILNGSGWSLGVVDVPGIRDLEAEKISRLQLIKQVQEIWGGYLVWDSINKIVHLRNGAEWQNYTGFQVKYKKNLKHITRTQSNKIITKMYPFGHDDLDIATVNGGVKYLTNNSYSSKVYVGIYKNQDIYDAAELKEKAIADLSLICRPRYTYKLRMVDLRTLPEYSHENFALGDMADIITPKIDVDERLRIIRHKYDIFRPWKCELDLGDPEERLIENLKASFDTTGFIDGKFNSAGKLSGHSIEDLTITANLIQNLAITSEKIANFAVTSNKIDNFAVTTNKIDNLAITSDKIATAAITGSKIENLAITNSHIANLTITGSKIANATIDNAKITSLSADKIITGQFNAITGMKLGNNDNINKVFRLATGGGIDIVLMGITGIGPHLTFGSLPSSSPDSSSPNSLQAILFNAATVYSSNNGASLTSFEGVWNFYGSVAFAWSTVNFTNANVIGLPYITQAQSDDRYCRNAAGSSQRISLQVYNNSLEVFANGSLVGNIPIE